jgi:hypothetical protein
LDRKIGELFPGMGRDENHGTRVEATLLYEPTREIEAALRAEIDVDEDDLRLELLGALKRLSLRRGDADDADSLLHQESAGRIEKARAVVHDKAGKRHWIEHRSRCSSAHCR